MAQHVTHKNGFTLLELVLYMSIFSVLLIGILYSSFYLQKVLEYNSTESKIKKMTYIHLALLQEHMKKSSAIRISTSSIEIVNLHNSVIQRVSNGDIQLTYGTGKILEPLQYIEFEEFSFKPIERQDTFETKNTIEVHVRRKDSKGKEVYLIEQLLAPTVDFLTIP